MQDLSASYGDVLLSWEAPEHEPLELGPRSSVIVVVILIAIIAFALYTNSPLMAITFILIGVVGYLSINRGQRILAFYVTTKGIIAGNEFYEYGNVESFHFYEEPPFENLLSLKTNGALVPYAHVPIIPTQKDALRDMLDEYIPEDKHVPSLVDTLEKLLHI